MPRGSFWLKFGPKFEKEILIFGLAFSYQNFESLHAKEGKAGGPHDLVCRSFRGIRTDGPPKNMGKLPMVTQTQWNSRELLA
jgi:hypothetical protein